MNKQRRSTIMRASAYLERALDLIRDAKDDEQYALSNMPENLQNSERCEAMERAVDNLEDALDSINEAKNSLNEAIS